MKTTLKKFVISTLLTLLLLAPGLFGYTIPAFAACYIVRGSDSGGWPGADNPGNDHGSYAPDANWHDLRFYDCGYQYDNWSRDTNIRWGSAEKAKLDREYLYRTIVHEVRMHPLWDYDNTGWTSTSLPISGVDHGSAWEEWWDNYREVEFQIWNPSWIQAGFNYYASVEWEGFDYVINSNVYAESEYCDNDWRPLYYDEIGWAKLDFSL